MGRLSVNNAASCGVCGSTGTATNQLVFCVRCNACQHRSCGGLIPTVGEEEDEDEFFCVACTANRDSAPRRRSRSRSRARNCELTLSCALCKQTSTVLFLCHYLCCCHSSTHNNISLSSRIRSRLISLFYSYPLLSVLVFDLRFPMSLSSSA